MHALHARAGQRRILKCSAMGPMLQQCATGAGQSDNCSTCMSLVPQGPLQSIWYRKRACCFTLVLLTARSLCGSGQV